MALYLRKNCVNLSCLYLYPGSVHWAKIHQDRPVIFIQKHICRFQVSDKSEHTALNIYMKLLFLKHLLFLQLPYSHYIIISLIMCMYVKSIYLCAYPLSWIALSPEQIPRRMCRICFSGIKPPLSLNLSRTDHKLPFCLWPQPTHQNQTIVNYISIITFWRCDLHSCKAGVTMLLFYPRAQQKHVRPDSRRWDD